MPHDLTPSGDPIGPVVAGWTARPRPPRTPMEGRLVTLVPLSAEAHARDLFDAHALDTEGRNWTYLGTGPYTAFEAFRADIDAASKTDDPLHVAVVDRATGTAVGTASFLRIDPANGVVEVGWITFSPLLQRTPASTEAMYLMMKRAFDELGYRRYEWKCNALNGPSRRAAERLGFTFEGVFRQAVIVKGRSRDTAWYAILDSEWPRAKAAFEAWLDPSNFDGNGRQKRRLEDLRAGA